MYKNTLATLRRDVTRSVLRDLGVALTRHVSAETNKCLGVINALLRSKISQKLSPSPVDIRAYYVINIAEFFPDVELMYRPALERELIEHETLKNLHRSVSSYFSGCLVTSGLVKERPAQWVIEVSCVA